MIKYSEEFAKKDFTSETMKEAYMKAVKWYATNILSNDILKDVQVSYEKVDDGALGIRGHDSHEKISSDSPLIVT